MPITTKPLNQSGGAGRNWRRRLLRLVLVAIATYAFMCMMFAAFQRHMIYYPSRDYVGTPQDYNMVFEDLTLPTSDGESVTGWFVPALNSQTTVLFCHGNAGNISHRLHSIQLLHNAGFNVFIFDYRGYGLSTGSPDEQGLYTDAMTAWNYLIETRGVPAHRIVLLGRSLGGAVAIELATKVQAGGLIAESTFTRLADVARRLYPLIPSGLLLRDRYDSVDKIPQITCPKLFLHGGQDSLIPLSLGRQLYEAANAPKRFIETPGDHNESGFTYSPKYTDQLVSFIRESQRS